METIWMALRIREAGGVTGVTGMSGHEGLFVKIDLRGSDAGFGEENAFLARGVAGGVKGDFGTRADEAHIAAEDVEKLGKLVDFGFAEEAAERSDARIAS